jgi:hypothetical protein
VLFAEVIRQIRNGGDVQIEETPLDDGNVK